MADFDITTIHSKDSFLATMKKRKAFGLMDSDSEDDDKPEIMSKKANIKSSDNSRPPALGDSTNKDTKSTSENTEKASAKPINPYVNKGFDLDFIKSLSATPAPIKKPTLVTEQSTSVIELQDDDDDKEIVQDAKIDGLDPELAAIMDKTSSRRVLEPQKISIKLQYVHTFQNISSKVAPLLEKLLKPIKLIIMDNTQFQKILDVFCTHKKLKKSEIVLIFNNDRLFLNGTPAGVGMSPNTTNTIEVYTEKHYKEVQDAKELKRQERLKKWTQTKEQEDLFDSAQFEDAGNEATAASDENEDKIFLKLRGSDNKDIMLRVKHTSTIASIIEKYKEIIGIDAHIKLSFEGEHLSPDSTVSDVDLEDEDMVEVHKLS